MATRGAVTSGTEIPLPAREEFASGISPQKTFTEIERTVGTNASVTARKIVALGVLSVLLATSGCVGGLGDSPATSGDISIWNDDNQSHEVVIHSSPNEDISRTVAANSSQIVSIHDRPGTYEVNVTVDGMWHDNTTIEYYAAGENGEQLGGPRLELWIEPDGRPNLAVAYD